MSKKTAQQIQYGLKPRPHQSDLMDVDSNNPVRFFSPISKCHNDVDICSFTHSIVKSLKVFCSHVYVRNSNKMEYCYHFLLMGGDE